MEKIKKDFVTNHDAMLVDLVSGEKLHFQGLPTEIEVNPETSWATIKPFGRNNPHYHFTGSEDTIVLEVSWYTKEDNREDVIQKCKWVESLLKADGYTGGPHRVSLVWGKMFKSQEFIVFSAPYRIGLFSKQHGMLPQVAFQTITLKKVTTHNYTLKEVLNFE